MAQYFHSMNGRIQRISISGINLINLRQSGEATLIYVQTLYLKPICFFKYRNTAFYLFIHGVILLVPLQPNHHNTCTSLTRKWFNIFWDYFIMYIIIWSLSLHTLVESDITQFLQDCVGRWFVITRMFPGVIEFRNLSLAMCCTCIDVFVADFGHLT